MYIGSDDNNVYGLSTARVALKRVVWRYTTQKGVDGTVALSPDGGALYIGSFDMSVYALATIG